MLRSTKLRKHVATLCQLLDLSNQELEQVAKFMGHDIRVHCNYYRQTDKTFQVAKVGKLLFAMEGGAEALKGKTLQTLDAAVCDQTELQHSDLEAEADGPMDKPPDVSDEEELEPTSTKAQKNKRTKRIDACAEVSDEEELEPTSTKAQKNKRTKRTDACAEVSDEEELEPTSTKAQKNKRTKRIDACAEVSDEEELEPTSTKAQKNKRTKRIDEASRNPKKPWSEEESRGEEDGGAVPQEVLRNVPRYRGVFKVLSIPLRPPLAPTSLV
uniref:Uncharacterized protein n=1 Tax=Knipowitschia caucasica TaxID=637954 RepID=A0AAV2KYY6_KNICA